MLTYQCRLKNLDPQSPLVHNDNDGSHEDYNVLLHTPFNLTKQTIVIPITAQHVTKKNTTQPWVLNNQELVSS